MVVYVLSFLKLQKVANFKLIFMWSYFYENLFERIMLSYLIEFLKFYYDVRSGQV